MNVKDRFLSNPDFQKRHADMVASAWFQDATEKTLLECASKWAKDLEPEAAHFKTQGAFEFVKIFFDLSKPLTQPIRKDLDNLT